MNEKELKQFIDKLNNDYKVAAPVKKQQGKQEILEYDYIEEFEEIHLEEQPDKSPKEFFLPQNEVLDPEAIAKSNPEENKTIIFGVRSCDIEALRVFDDVFLNDTYVDPYYEKRRDNTIIIGYSCPHREPTCFCDQLGISPHENKLADLYLYKFDDKYWIKSINEDSEKLIKDLADGDEDLFDEKLKNKKDNFGESDFKFNMETPIPEEKAFNAPIWDDIAEKCLGCGVCTYYCPTCFCFNFFFDEDDKENQKYRSWDSCMFSLFTKHASGHNPRETQGQRWRQRLMHKFSYHPQNYGGLSCVGCGRCVKKCPVTLDIREALKSTEEYLKDEGGAVVED